MSNYIVDPIYKSPDLHADDFVTYILKNTLGSEVNGLYQVTHTSFLIGDRPPGLEESTPQNRAGWSIMAAYRAITEGSQVQTTTAPLPDKELTYTGLKPYDYFMSIVALFGEDAISSYAETYSQLLTENNHASVPKNISKVEPVLPIIAAYKAIFEHVIDAAFLEVPEGGWRFLMGLGDDGSDLFFKNTNIRMSYGHVDLLGVETEPFGDVNSIKISSTIKEPDSLLHVASRSSRYTIGVSFFYLGGRLVCYKEPIQGIIDDRLKTHFDDLKSWLQSMNRFSTAESLESRIALLLENEPRYPEDILRDIHQQYIQRFTEFPLKF